MSAVSAIENLSEIIQREVQVAFERFTKGIFSVLKEDCPDIDPEDYDFETEKYAKNVAKKIIAAKDFKKIEKKLVDTPKRDPDAPKAAKNAFICFCTEKRGEVKKEFAKLKPSDITKKLGEMWREMDDEEKEEYYKAAKDDKERFDNEMEDYEPKEGFKCPKKSPKKAKSDSPKRARSAFLFFCQEKREEVTKKLAKEGKKSEVMKKLGEMWREMDEDDKKKYEKKAKEDKKRYENEMKNFKEENDENDDDDENDVDENDEEKEENDKKSKKSDKKSKKDEDKEDKKSKKSKKEAKSDKEKDEKKSKRSKKDKTPKKSSDCDDELLSE